MPHTEHATAHIDELSPGEVVLGSHQLAEARRLLADSRGQLAVPITVYRYEQFLIVRDGNHRVRAWVEYYDASEAEIPEIPICYNPIEPSVLGLRELVAAALFCDTGKTAILTVRVVPQDNKPQAHTEMMRTARALLPPTLGGG